MSTGERIESNLALNTANHVRGLIEPYCQRIEIAGSLRRGKPDVGDIEIVAIPFSVTALLVMDQRPSWPIRDVLGGRYKFLMGGEHLQKYDVGICTLELYLTNPECWGVIFTLRTGPADFSHRLVTPRRVGGYLPSYLQVKDGRVCNRSDGALYDTPEEISFFKAIGMEYIEPGERK